MQSEARDVKNDAGFVVKVEPGIVAIQAFQTSDGKLFVTHQKAKEHEAIGVLKQDLSKRLKDYDEVHVILSFKESIFKALTAYFKAVE